MNDKPQEPMSVFERRRRAEQRPAPVSAMKLLTRALQDDPEYAWAWHCNLAMPIMDEVRCSHEQANRAAAKLMRHLFSIDITKHAHWTYK